MPILESRRKAKFCIVLIAISVFRFSYLGFQYTPYLDDHIQYFFYPTFNKPWQNILTGGAGILFTRPLAGLFDFFLWSNFKNSLGCAVAIISFLHGLSGLLFCKAFRRIGIDLGTVFLVFFLFLPVNCEGTYWLSASTRIVVSLFLISLSLVYAARGSTVLFAVFNFLSLWFYEQTAVLALIAGIIFYIFKKEPLKLFIPFVSFALLAVFYLWFGRYGDNAHRFAPVKIQNLISHTAEVVSETVRILGPVSWRLTATGFVRSIHIIFRGHTFFWFFTAGLLSVSLLALSDFRNGQPLKVKIICGTILAFVPLLPFFATENNSLNLRNIVPCLLGLAIVADALLPVLFKSFTPFAVSICLIIFSVSAVSEVFDYEKTARHDLALAESIIQKLPKDAAEISVKLTVPAYLPQNAVYADHIKSMVASDWGVSGIVRTISQNKSIVVNVDRSEVIR